MFTFPPQRHRRPPVTLLVGIGILLFLLIGGSIFFLIRSKSNTPPSIGSGVIPGITPGTQPLFTDDFANNSKGWAIGSGSGYTSVVGNYTMLLAEANHKILAEPIPGDGGIPATYRDFSVTSTFTITRADQNDSVGFYMRGDNNLSQGYFVDIFGDNTYDIVKVFPNANQDAFLISPTNSAAINPVGQPNRLTVMMKGPKIVMLINGKVVNTISDSAYKIGQIALFAENGRSSDGVKVTFSSISVYPAPEQLPA